MKFDLEVDGLAVVAGAVLALPFVVSTAVAKRKQFKKKDSKLQEAEAESPSCNIEEPNPEPSPAAPAFGGEVVYDSATQRALQTRSGCKAWRSKVTIGLLLMASALLLSSALVLLQGHLDGDMHEEGASMAPVSDPSSEAPAVESSMLNSEAAAPLSESVDAEEHVSRDANVMAPLVPVQVGQASANEQASAKPPVTIELKRQHVTMQSSKDKYYFKNAYYGTLQLGTPAVAYTFVFDTGSGHLVLPSAYCHSKTCKAHKRYRRSASKTARDIDYDGTPVNPTDSRDQINVQFGTGDITGVFVEDVVCMDNGALQTLAWQNEQRPDVTEADADEAEAPLPAGCARMRFIAATEMSEQPFETFMFDGILGLGLSELSQTPEFNFINVLSKFMQGWGSNMPHTFAVFLGQTWGEKSELALGGWDEDHLDGGLYWNAVHRPELGHWIVRVKSVRVDGELVDFCNEGCKAVVDTGTSLMAVPPAVFPEIYELMRHPAALDGLCKGTGPQLHIELEHFTVTMDPEDYARPEWYKESQYEPQLGPVTPYTFEEESGDITRNDIYCRPMLMSMDLPEPIGPKLFILGEPVLRKYYTVYDADKKRVGFGRANHAEAPASVVIEDDVDDSWFDVDDDNSA
eukprot:TRINITY_DN12362_c0_g1_i1.p1 TRINITY_DN12362_c0_g1~~TRINITY_DN12362_c0_g1_i1.p1  ORF type:complete len:631 (+),score=135.09 TRINITY_DN12362_c0_g1_i1:79-1971(+)